MPKREKGQRRTTTTRSEKNVNRIFWFLLTWVCFALCAVIVWKTFSPIVELEVNYQLKTKSSQEQAFPVDELFSILIPKINANSRVIKDVDPENSSIYQAALAHGVAHAKGSALPGQAGNVFIFAHSATSWLEANSYNAVFYLINKLEKQDVVEIYFLGKKYKYVVTEKKIVDSGAVEYLKSHSDKKTLTLMTCWPPGTSLKRLIVKATLLE